ncbi:actinorhodin polyketide beta-ketoacyl synthase [Streptomyces kronopolitis]|uniref:Actinorhodin polyketide beta-ketoacyl synthase n=1 Tax=Streptomyces kronopolitis TaxID=1612435 RepID=A0ABQ2J4J7_9ACTN|nr:ketosynthase chain-length factor [Streptomyces kronopolitis]GGN36535.1 actinorhodin polyketide beta-ketoacyl synthase [Streptomyces kronopolitis]
MSESRERQSTDGGRARAVFTGIGVVAPNGKGTEDWWAATLAGKSGIDTVRSFDARSYPSQLAGEIKGFDPGKRLSARIVVETSRMSHFALAATRMALDDATVDLSQIPEYELGVITANASGGAEFGQRELQKLWRGGPKDVSPYMSIAWFYAATTGQISIGHGMRGPCGVMVSEQAGGLDALGQARRVVRDGTRLVVTGGSDSSLSPAGFVSQLPTANLTTVNDPARAYLPFDTDASGFVPGEGGAILVLENADTARERGVDRPYGELAGYAATFDPRPGSGRPPTLTRCARAALADARMRPEDIDVVFADGHGTAEKDRQESRTLAELFGPRAVPVTVPKTTTGRLYAGAGALDTAGALLALRDQVVPPTIHVKNPVAAYELDLVIDQPRETVLRTAMVIARGHGGFNAVAIVRLAD